MTNPNPNSNPPTPSSTPPTVPVIPAPVASKKKKGLALPVLPANAVTTTSVSPALIERAQKAALSPWIARLFWGIILVWFVGGRLLDGTAQTIAYTLAGLLWMYAMIRLTLAARDAENAASASARAWLRGQGISLLGIFLAGGAYGMYARDAAGSSAGAWLASSLALVLIAAANLLSMELLAMRLRDAWIIEELRLQEAQRTGLILGLLLATLGFFNYSAAKIDVKHDFSYQSPHAPSAATLAAVDGLADRDLEIYLFYENNAPMLGEIGDYFSLLASHFSSGHVTVTVQDQAADPILAKTMKAPANGYIGFRVGGRVETWALGENPETGRNKLKELDQEVRKRISKVARDAQIVYMTQGHGERPFSDAVRSEGPAYKSLNKLADSLNVKIKGLGLPEGLGNSIPADAAVVIVAGPEQVFLESEVNSLKAYLDQGGALAILADKPDVIQSLQPLYERLHIAIDTSGLVRSDKEYLRRTKTASDTGSIVGYTFGSHLVTKELAPMRERGAVAFIDALAIQNKRSPSDTNEKYTALVKSSQASFIDRNNNLQFDEVGADQEIRSASDLAVAIEDTGTKAGLRVVIIGDTDVWSDTWIRIDGNAIFTYSALSWLLREDVGIGAVTPTQDIPIRHTQGSDVVWFYGTIFGAPVLVLSMGFVVTKRRARQRTAREPTKNAGDGV